mmetsp:Transcript_24661/g.80629  ORF Transcript_24661/g.80629 Transcript_24661/m.80629 type:complete len:294 (-) Transcript_24661:2365-3246(-)
MLSSRVAVVLITTVPKSRAEGSSRVAPEVPSPVTLSKMRVSSAWSWVDLMTSGTLVWYIFCFCGAKLQCSFAVSFPRRSPAGTSTWRMRPRRSGMFQANVTGTRLTLWMVYVRVEEAPKHVGLKKRPPLFSSSICGRKLLPESGRSTAFAGLLLSTQRTVELCEPPASLRYLSAMSWNPCAGTTPLRGRMLKGAEPGLAAALRGLSCMSKLTSVSPLLRRLTTWYAASPRWTGGKLTRFALNTALGMNSSEERMKVWPCAWSAAVHGGQKLSSVTSRKERIVLTYAKHSSCCV